ncbi:MAG: twin-arginine translocation signal domain-containing protein [Acidobacteriota bacterium]
MSISRRKFLGTAPAAIGAVLLIQDAVGQKALTGRLPKSALSTDVLSRLTWSSFLPYVNTDFTFRDTSGRSTTLVLTNMTDSKPEKFVQTSAKQECFAMTFKGPAKGSLSQNTYSVEHFALGKFDLFITFLGKTSKSSTYTAVINRLV